MLSISVFADDGPLFVYDTNCEKDGSLTLFFGTYSSNNIYTEDIKVKAEYIGEAIIRKPKFDVVGIWSHDFINEDVGSIKERTTLTSEEAVFNLTGKYIITVDYMHNNLLYTTSHKTYCPGFEFSCKLIGVYVDDCRNINNERFEASARIYGMGDITKENLTLDDNIKFMLWAEFDYEDFKGHISERGSLPKGVKISNPEYGQYYFNVSNFDNKIKSFVGKFIGINSIEGGCVNYPNISLYSYKECEDIIIEEKPEPVQVITSKTVSETKQEILEELEKNVGTEKESKWHLVILFVIFGFCIIGVLYITFKRKFNKEPRL